MPAFFVGAGFSIFLSHCAIDLATGYWLDSQGGMAPLYFWCMIPGMKTQVHNFSAPYRTAFAGLLLDLFLLP